MDRITHKFLAAFILCALAVCSQACIASRKPNQSGSLELETATPFRASSGFFRNLVIGFRQSPPSSLPILQLIWQCLDFPALPPPRVSFSLALDTTQNRAYLFGGNNSDAGALNDLWSTNGNEWTQLQPSRKPIERAGASLIYDEARQETILFGGAHSSEYLGSTWKYVPYNWYQQIPPISPPARANACLAYDASRNVTLLFGGFNPFEGENYLNDTWAWDGLNWQQQHPSPSPSPRYRANMVYDRARQNILLFGGAVGGGILADTWIWDGATWVEQHPIHSPPGRSHFGMAYDEGRQQVILFGGQAIGGAATDTWAWDGQDWAQLQTFLQPPEEIALDAQLVYLPDLQTTALVADSRKKDCSVGDCTFTEETQVWALAYRYLGYLPMVSR